MTYFANGRQAIAFNAMNCDRCANYENAGVGGCAILDIHFVHGADQLAPGQEKLKDVLDMLISDDWKCAMFRDNGKQS